MEFKGVRRFFSVALIATSIVGCGGAGSDYDWRVKLFDGADDDFIESVGRLGAIWEQNDGYLVYAADYRRSYTNFFTQIAADGSTSQEIDNQVHLAYELIPSNTGLLFSPSATSFGRGLDRAGSPVRAVNPNGELLWERMITPDMEIESTVDATEFVNLYFVHNYVSGGPDEQPVDLVLTGLDAQGQVTWQRINHYPNTAYSRTRVFYTETGDLCYAVDDGLYCVDYQGNEQLLATLPAENRNSVRIFAQNILVINIAMTQQNYATVINRATGLSDTFAFNYSSFDDAEETADGSLFLLKKNFYNEQTLIELTWGSDNKIEVSEKDYEIENWYDGYTFFSGGNALLDSDAAGNLYMSWAATEPTKVLGLDATKIRGVVIKRDPEGVESTVVKGKWTTYNHMKDGECVNRCVSIPKIDYLDSFRTMADGSVMVLWADTSMEQLCGEIGFCGIVPIVTESWDIAKYSAVE